MEIKKYAKKVFSQNGEDGVIEHIFNNIGVTNEIFVEFGFNFHENNSRNLIENYGFRGLFIDGKIPDFLCNKTINNIHHHQAWLTRNNINQIIGNYYKGDIDFLSIDVDGIDIYLLDRLNIVKPSVICIEYCASIGNELSVAVKYKDDFDRHKEHPSGFYANASLQANINVMKKKGYKFIGTIHGLNAFFVRNDCNLNNLKELTCKEGYEPHYSRTYETAKRWDGESKKVSTNEQYEWIKDLEWIRVDANGDILFENDD